MALLCRVKLLDESEIEVNIGKKGKGSDLLDSVCQYVNLVEKDYFGLIHKDTSLQKLWVKLDKPLKKQFPKKAKLEFEFLVKYYPTNPPALREEITRYQICLQIRQDLLSGSLTCPPDKLAHLSSYWLQSEFGDGDADSKEVKDYLASLKYPGEATLHEFEEKVISLYRSRRGMKSADADTQFLVTALSLPMYGVHFFLGKDSTKNEAKIGISSGGITVKPEAQTATMHSWQHIKNIEYRKNKFKIKLIKAPSEGDPRLKKTFFFSSEDEVHNIWKNSVDQHVFFRIDGKAKQPTAAPTGGRKPKKKKSLLRRLSSRKKKPKTEADVQEESANIKRKQPTVIRTSSLRRSASLQNSSSGESSPISSKQPEGAVGGVVEPTDTAIYSSIPESEESVSPSFETETKKVFQSQTRAQVQLPPLYASVHKEKENEEQESSGEEFKDEDIMEAVIGRMDGGNTSGGSSTLLLTETILEEDEEQVDVPVHKKDHLPVTYVRLRDEETTVDIEPPVIQDSLLHPYQESRRIGQMLETALDSPTLLDPKFLQPSQQKDEESTTLPEAFHFTRTEEITDIVDQYTEVWEEIEVEPPSPRRRKDVRFENGEKVSELEHEEENLDELKEADDKSDTSSSTLQGEVYFNSLGDQQMQNLPEDEELKVQEISLPVYDDLHGESDINTTIKEYIPTLRKDTSDEESEAQEEEYFPHYEHDTHSTDRVLQEAFTEDVEPYSILEASTLDNVLDQRFNENEQVADNVVREVFLGIPNVLISPAVPNDIEDSSESSTNEKQDFLENKKIEFEEEDENVIEISEEESMTEMYRTIPPLSYEDDTRKQDFRNPLFLDPMTEVDKEDEDFREGSEEGESTTEIYPTIPPPSYKDERNEKDFRSHLFLDPMTEVDKEDEDFSEGSDEESTTEMYRTISPPLCEDDMRKGDFHNPLFLDAMHGLGHETDAGAFTLGLEVKSGRDEEKTIDGVASTTGATVGDEYTLAIEDLENDILYEEERYEEEEEGSKQDTPEVESQEKEDFFPSPNESESRSTSLSDITDNTDELLLPNILEKTWSQGAGLDEDDEFFQFLFRTPPRRRKRRRNWSDINPLDVPRKVQEARVFKTTIDEGGLSPRRTSKKGETTRRPFIPSWPFDPSSIFDSRDLEELDKEAIKAAIHAQKELLEESKRITDMEFLDEEDFPYPDFTEDVIEKTIRKPYGDSDYSLPPRETEIPEFIAKISSSPSTSPRMVGEAFIPGVPDFVHSVIPYQLKTPSVSEDSQAEETTPTTPKDLEAMKFPKPILKFSTSTNEKYRYSPPTSSPDKSVSDTVFDITQTTHSSNNFKSSGQSIDTSGRSTPQSSGATSSSKSSTSKSSGSSFPRFVHSVFPLRRSSSSDKRGRSKTRRKREKKLAKQKNKKRIRSGSRNKDSQNKKTNEVTSSQEGTNKILDLPPPPQYSTTLTSASGVPLSMYFPSASRLGLQRSDMDFQFQQNIEKLASDQVSLDKIVLTESDDAHSDEDTPVTVRRAEGFEDTSDVDVDL